MRRSVFEKTALWAIALSITFVTRSAQTTTFANRPLSEIMKEAPNVVRGKPQEQYSDWDKGNRRQIFTYTNLVVTEVLKGDIRDNKILLRQPGGSKDGMEMSVPGVAHFSSDEDVVVLLGKKNDEDGSYDVPGFATGKYNVATGENGEPILINSLGGAAIYDPNRDPRSLSYNSKIPLEVFRRIVRGEDIPEAAHKQFEGSEKPAPEGAYEANHRHGGAIPARREPPAAVPRSTAPKQPATESDAAGTKADGSATSPWPMVIIYGAIVALGAVLLWGIMRRRRL